MYFVYILKSTLNSKSYVGFTSHDVNKRLKQHNIGSNIWTSKNRPFKILYYESYVCKTDAMLRERFFKSGIGKKLKKLIIENYRGD